MALLPSPPPPPPPPPPPGSPVFSSPALLAVAFQLTFPAGDFALVSSASNQAIFSYRWAGAFMESLGLRVSTLNPRPWGPGIKGSGSRACVSASVLIVQGAVRLVMAASSGDELPIQAAALA